MPVLNHMLPVTRQGAPLPCRKAKLQKHIQASIQHLPTQQATTEAEAHHISQHQTSTMALITHILEPFFVPKLQNSFADFPNLHYSISLEAVHLGDLMRLSVRCCPKRIYSLDFSRILHSAPDATKIATLCTTLNPISA